MRRFFLVALPLLTVAAVQAQVAELDKAVRGGDIQRVTRLLQGKPELALARIADGKLPLFLLGAQRVETNMAALFLAHGADVKQTNSEGQTAVHLAAKSGSITGLKALLAAKADVNARDSRGMTPLMLTPTLIAEEPSVPAAELLLGHGADPNLIGHLGNTALHLASSSGDAALVDFLLRHGAQPNITNNFGLTPLASAGLMQRSNVVRVFENHGLRLREVRFNVEPGDVQTNSVTVELRQTLKFRLVKEKEAEFRAFVRTNIGARLHFAIKGQDAWTQILDHVPSSPISHRFARGPEPEKWASLLTEGGAFRRIPSETPARRATPRPGTRQKAAP